MSLSQIYKCYFWVCLPSMKCQGLRMLERTGVSYAQLRRTIQPETLPPLRASTLSPAMLAGMRRWILHLTHLNGWANVSYFDNGWFEFLFTICRSLPFTSIYTVNAPSVMTSPCACCQEEATIDPWHKNPDIPEIELPTWYVWQVAKGTIEANIIQLQTWGAHLNPKRHCETETFC